MSSRRLAAWTAALALLCFLTALSPAADSDIWWHLAAGRQMWRTGGFLRTDPFSLDAAGRPWIDLHWLFQIGAFGMHSAGGLLAVVLAKALAVAAGAVFLALWVFRAARAGGAGAAAKAGAPLPGDPAPARAAPGAAVMALTILLPGALLFVRHLILVRPVVVTLVYLAVACLILESYRADGRARRLWWLLPLQVAWTNTQGLFVLGPVVVACFATGGLLGRWSGRPELPARGGRRLWGVCLLMLAASLVNPYGLRALVLPLELFARLLPGGENVFSAHIAENVPPWVLERTAPGHLAPFAGMLALSILGFWNAGRRLVWGRVFLVAAFAGLAALANRNLLLFHWLAAPVAALHLGPVLARRWAALERPAWQRWLRFLPGVAAGAVFAAACLALANEPALTRPAPFRTPHLAVANLRGAPAGGRIFAADHYGGYLIWHLFPRHRPYLDTRLVLRTADEYREFLGLLDYPERWEGFTQGHPVDVAVLPAAFPDRYLGLIRHLHRSPDWRLCATDGSEVVFVRAAQDGLAARRECPAPDLADPVAVAGIVEHLAPATSEVGRAARRHLGRLLMLLEHHRASQAVLRKMPPEDGAAQVLLAHSLLASGEIAEAENLANRLLGRQQEEAAAYTLLAMAALARGQTQAALRFLGDAFDHDPYNVEAEALLSELEAEQRRMVPPDSGLQSP